MIIESAERLKDICAAIEDIHPERTRHDSSDCKASVEPSRAGVGRNLRILNPECEPKLRLQCTQTVVGQPFSSPGQSFNGNAANSSDRGETLQCHPVCCKLLLMRGRARTSATREDNNITNSPRYDRAFESCSDLLPRLLHEATETDTVGCGTRPTAFCLVAQLHRTGDIPDHYGSELRLQC